MNYESMFSASRMDGVLINIHHLLASSESIPFPCDSDVFDYGRGIKGRDLKCVILSFLPLTGVNG